MAPASPTTSFSSRHRPALLLGAAAGLVSALVPVLTCAGLALAGWYLSDAGGHGAAGDAMGVGAIAWLVGHGAGFTVGGASVTVLPLAVTLTLAWWTWRTGVRLGESVWAHGPDVHRIGDGERDWTVPQAVAGLVVGYLATLLVVLNLVSGPSYEPRLAPALTGALALSLLVGGPAVAVGSGRAAIWAAGLPPVARHAFAAARRILVWYVVASTAVFLLAMGLGISEAGFMVSQLGLSPSEAFQYALLNLAFLPNAVLFTGAFLLGPGFAAGTATVVSPSAVVLGPLPLLGLFAALPAPGVPATGWALTIAVPVVVAAWAAGRHQWERPTLRWDHGVLRACAGGLLAATALTVLMRLSGGSAGPGRMSQVAPFTSEVLLHGLVAFGFGALAGGLLMTWWQRRTSVPASEPIAVTEPSAPAP
ncbi:DUF6350 family protein [Nocardioides gilvus]|uniref:cell division protein PerM n=1 Tax=Nocardioides gilvus TaxID=1735589 RepID=UPI000D742877|nr:DUF6350 family protein [Nocardioides gilvus]